MTHSGDVAALAGALSRVMPTFAPLEQSLAVELYRHLAAGAPVRPEALAEALGLRTRAVAARLDAPHMRALLFYDDDRRIIGFGGLTIVPMRHEFRVNGRTLFTWCAWDGLFIPEVLGLNAEITSTCPETGQTVRLTMTPRGIAAAAPAHLVLSFLLPDAPLFEQTTAETVRSFCHFIHFLASPQAATAWTARHEGTFVLSLDDGVVLGTLNNAARFGAALAESGATDGGPTRVNTVGSSDAGRTSVG